VTATWGSAESSREHGQEKQTKSSFTKKKGEAKEAGRGGKNRKSIKAQGDWKKLREMTMKKIKRKYQQARSVWRGC